MNIAIVPILEYKKKSCSKSLLYSILGFIIYWYNRIFITPTIKTVAPAIIKRALIFHSSKAYSDLYFL